MGLPAESPVWGITPTLWLKRPHGSDDDVLVVRRSTICAAAIAAGLVAVSPEPGKNPLLITLNPSDRERAATALRFYVERASWSSGDTERAEFVRLLAELEAPPATRETAETFHRASVGVGTHRRGEPTWPEWHAAVPGVTRVENVRTGRRGTFSRWPAVHGRRNPGYAVIEWDDNGSSGRVVAYAFDLREVRD